MENKLERLIKALYREYKAKLDMPEQAHPDEEDLACFLEGRLSVQEGESIKQHLMGCKTCAQIFVLASRLEIPQESAVPQELLMKIRNQAREENTGPETGGVLEILVGIKNNFIELLKTNGDVLVGQELMPAPLLRSRQIKDFKDEVTILKDFDNLRVEIKIEKKDAASFYLILAVKEKKTLRIIKDLRVTLLKEGTELESYVADTGKVVFEHVLLGSYTIEISDTTSKLASIVLEAKV